MIEKYVVVFKKFPEKKEGEFFVAHVHKPIDIQLVQYPRIDSVQLLLETDFKFEVNSVYLYKIILDRPLVKDKNDWYYFRLSHHTQHNIKYEEKLYESGKFDIGSGLEMSLLVRFRLQNGVKGKMYDTLDRAQKSYQTEINVSKHKELLEKENLKQKYLKYKEYLQE